MQEQKSTNNSFKVTCVVVIPTMAIPGLILCLVITNHLTPWIPSQACQVWIDRNLTSKSSCQRRRRSFLLCHARQCPYRCQTSNIDTKMSKRQSTWQCTPDQGLLSPFPSPYANDSDVHDAPSSRWGPDSYPVSFSPSCSSSDQQGLHEAVMLLLR